MNFYKYAFVDLSYVLSRNTFSLKSMKPNRSVPMGYTAGDIVRLTIQTINKCCRDYNITADKYIFLRDTWDKTLGGYYRTSLLPKNEYKGTRKYMTRYEFEKLKADPSVTPEDLKKAEEDLYKNETMSQAKKILTTELGNFGIPTLSVEAWECDDLSYLAGALLMNDPDPKKSVVITKDSDIQYNITPKMDYFRIPTGGSAPQVIMYDQMWNNMPLECRNLGMSLYDYHAIWESIGQGHNDMVSTKKDSADVLDTIIKCYKGDLSNIADPELYLKHMETFKIDKFPRLQEAIDLINNTLPVVGRLGNLEEFKNFCARIEVSEISDKYFTEFINRFDPTLYHG